MAQINLNLPDDVHQAARVHGITRRLTLAEVIAEALRAHLPDLATPVSATPPTRVKPKDA